MCRRGEEWAPYWTQSRSDFVLLFRCRCAPRLLGGCAALHWSVLPSAGACVTAGARVSRAAPLALPHSLTVTEHTHTHTHRHTLARRQTCPRTARSFPRCRRPPHLISPCKEPFAQTPKPSPAPKIPSVLQPRMASPDWPGAYQSWL
ncbi:hypothetical protein Q5P01_009269 [Channa striata]|uniref:Uncharacterized protein n=1 Tax=Channa striata TaxID=64152 RepID=A0AA88N3Q3_CHASR|nr:hypothetical protein Q5P01_009269 [Channa striata]